MPLLFVLLGVLILLTLIIWIKLNPFISFVIASLFIGVTNGLSFSESIRALETGMGTTLSSLIMILGFGAMLGKIVADSGAAQKITETLVQLFGLKNIQWALMLTGFIVGIPMFYSVGFVILVPLVFTLAASTGLPLVYIGLPMLASLSVTHGYLPPHPAPTAIAEMMNADIGKTLLFGIIIAIPAILFGGALFSKTLKKIQAKPSPLLYQAKLLTNDQLPSFGISIAIALLPIILIGTASIVEMLVQKDHPVIHIFNVLGNPSFAMLISVLVAIFGLGLRQGKSMEATMQSISEAISGITMVLLIIAGAGGLKQVLQNSGASEYIGSLLASSELSPLVLAWMVAALIRICVGSATVAGLTAAGIVFPMINGTEVSPELTTLAIGSGSLMLSHVNDGGFWLFKEYFNTSIKDTFLSWTIMESTVSLIGLAGVLTINQFI